MNLIRKETKESMTKRTRELNICDECKEPSFTDKCTYCRTVEQYKEAEENCRSKVPKW